LACALQAAPDAPVAWQRMHRCGVEGARELSRMYQSHRCASSGRCCVESAGDSNYACMWARIIGRTAIVPQRTHCCVQLLGHAPSHRRLQCIGTGRYCSIRCSSKQRYVILFTIRFLRRFFCKFANTKF